MRVTIDAARLAARLAALAQHGALATGGTYRPLYSEPWAAAQAMLAEWMQTAGLSARRDAVGNLWGRVEGQAPGPAIVSGSHLDTVRGGGNLDGALGVVAALTAVEALLAQHGPPRRPVEVLAICEEEGSRFRTFFWGARAVTGQIGPTEAQTVTDSEGVSLAAAMADLGLVAAAIPGARRDDLAAYVELHIEQGAVLESAALQVGVVEHIVGAVQLEVTVTGQPDHAGTTPMRLRRDALHGAAGMIRGIAQAAATMGEPAVATVGTLQVQPSQTNVVPGRVCFSVDARHADPAQLQALAVAIEAICRREAADLGLGVAVETLRHTPPVAMAPELVAVLEAAAADIGASRRRMVSGAGHDAQVLAAICPAAMLFVPSIGGRSHCPEEATDLADLVRGTQVLAAALHELAWA